MNWDLENQRILRERRLIAALYNAIKDTIADYSNEDLLYAMTVVLGDLERDRKLHVASLIDTLTEWLEWQDQIEKGG